MQDQAKKLIQEYVDGWKESDIDKIIEPLAKNCVIIESHGPTYHGVDQIRNWVRKWIKANGKVKRWDIKSFYFADKSQVAFFEWGFDCNINGKNYALLGLSVVKFKGKKISFIHEYRMTKNPHDWNQKQLNPD